MVIVVVKLAWSYNGWKGFDEHMFNKKDKYHYGYINKHGFAHECFNFYEDFDEEYYYGYIGNKKIKKKPDIILFVSRDIDAKKYYLIGFYDVKDYNPDGFKINKTFNDLIPNEYLKAISQELKISPDETVKGFTVKAYKKTSTVFHNKAYIEIEAKDIGVSSLNGQWGHTYIKTPSLVKNLLEKVKKKHEELLDLDEPEKSKIKNIIEKVDLILQKIGEQQSLSTTPNNIKKLTLYFNKKGYLFQDYTISQFYLALKTKGFLILSGLTGSGKTKLALEFARLLSNDKYLFLSAKPDWRDSKPLLGYYNPLTKEYQRTKLLDLILNARKEYEEDRSKAEPYFIILDEMNLAHVEYYFSDFLSVLESGRDEQGYTRESIKLHNINSIEQDIPKEIKLPPNLYIIGTVNIDETTYMFSPKVLDRAFVIEFDDIMLDQYPPNDEQEFDDKALELRRSIIDDLRRGGNFLYYSKHEEVNRAVNELKDSYWDILKKLNDKLSKYDLHFGYRIVDEIALFYKNAKDDKIVSLSNDEAIDLAIKMKILPKFHGNRAKVEKALKKVIETIEDGIDENSLNDIKSIDKLDNLKHTSRKASKMLRRLYEQGFTSYF